jgi:hypothetical protein
MFTAKLYRGKCLLQNVFEFDFGFVFSQIAFFIPLCRGKVRKTGVVFYTMMSVEGLLIIFLLIVFMAVYS